MNPADFIQMVMAICGAYGGSITSSWRSAAHNTAVGGNPQSLHLVGLAADIVFDTTAGKAQAIALAQRMGWGVLDEGDHVHVQAIKPAQNPTV